MLRIRLCCCALALLAALAAFSGDCLAAKLTATGFFVTDNGVLVTCGHVLRSSKLRVETPQGALPATVIIHDKEADIAVLQVNVRSVPVSLSSAFIGDRGDEVILLGYPLPTLQGREMKATFGRVNSVSGMRGDGRFFQFDAPTQPGNSGGPVLDSQGWVVGVLLRSLDEEMVRKEFRSTPQNVNYAIKVEHVLRVLGKAGILPRQDVPQLAKPSQMIRRIEPSVALITAG